MTDTHAFFVGSASAFNINRALANIGKSLNDKFELHLITTKADKLQSSVGEYYQLYGLPESDSRLSEFRVIKNYLRKHSPNSLTQITQPPIHGTLSSSLSTLLSDIPFIYRYSGDSFMLYNFYSGYTKYRNYFLYNMVGRLPLYQADKCIVFGEHGRNQLTKHGVSAKQIVRLPPMIDPERFQNTKPIKSYRDQTTFGFVGRVSRLKGSETLKHTLPEIIKQRPNCKFVFVGEINDNTLIKQFPDHVEFVGPVPPQQVPAYLKEFDVLIHPSLTEGIPRAVLEALYVSTPVIARDVGDISEVTNNLFNTDSEFVKMICNFESLRVDDISRFNVNNAGRDYVRFYNSISK